MIQHFIDNHYVELEEDDVELAKLLLAETDLSFNARHRIVKQFHQTTGSLGRAVATVHYALEQMGLE